MCCLFAEAIKAEGAGGRTEPDVATASASSEQDAPPDMSSSKLEAAEDEVKAAMQAKDVPSLQAAVLNLVRLMADSTCNVQQIAQVSLIRQHHLHDCAPDCMAEQSASLLPLCA